MQKSKKEFIVKNKNKKTRKTKKCKNDIAKKNIFVYNNRAVVWQRESPVPI